ncbi:carbohydrate ABC transporter permease [Tessaracoccus oleiagri]|uniref:Carbohydrate ABC transporter membrane protein 1, CUT1 family (TC 3.A.1.1.-) n=1 Tax=Tessaracoccus oleiagri TaxID=686624 RepID=A0A1G9JFY5_9ACTN|nr:sugar ABC transporter permease [Tessaracoccus oleiagri]SDL36212.1 carbohydrate ABC transporter membrane protein 1, CUT1 family (TC 3.A.1.1.-) [Tessaracoccus oleiagri]
MSVSTLRRGSETVASPPVDGFRTLSTGQRARKSLPIYGALSPYFLLFFTFGAMPMLFTMALAFTNWSGLGDIRFIGIENFRYLVTDPLFYKALGNTLILWVMGTVPTLTFATIVALMLNSTLRFSTTYRVIYLIPNVTSLVAMGILFSSLFSSQFGLANAIVNLFGFGNIAWLQNEWGIKIAISALTTWSFVGYNSLLILAGLQAIDKTQYESAALDGAGGWRTFFHITLPQLRPIVLFITLMSTIGSLQSFTEAQVLTSSLSSGAASAGGVGNSGLTMVLYFYSVAFQENRYGYGATIAWGVFVVVMFFSAINWIVTKERKERIAR